MFKGIIIDSLTTKKTEEERWWVVQTKPQSEFLAIERLKQQGMTTYCPMFKQESIRGQQVKVNTTPLFPRYVFVLVDKVAEQTVHTIRSTFGVSQLIKVGDQPSVIMGNIIDSIRVMQAEHLDQVTPRFCSQDKVIITEGLYKGLEVVYQMSDGLKRAVVLLNLLQQPTLLTLDKTQLKKSS